MKKILFLLLISSFCKAQITTNFFGSGVPTGILANAGILYIDVATRNEYRQGTIPKGTSWTVIATNQLVTTSFLQGVIPIIQGGTGQITAIAAINALLPSQTGNPGKFLQTNGSTASWVAGGGGTGTVTSVSVTNGTGISASVANSTTTPNITITNTLPDQTVVLTAGTGIGITGTYPSFTITNSSPSLGGTVTSVSVITANGISGSVATATTTPAITLTLGAITPTSVNGITLSGSGSIANTGISSLTTFVGSGTSSGTNTGDQTIAGLSPLTTKGDLFTYSTVNTRLAVGATDGQILGVSAAAATGQVWSTPSYPMARGTARTILVSNGTNNVYSTETYATPGTSGNILTSDGTNWTSAAPAGASLTATYVGYGSVGNTLTGASSLTYSGTVLTAPAVSIAGTAGAGYVKLIAQSVVPTSPAAGTLLLYSETTQGVTRLVQDNESTTNLTIGRDNSLIAKNTSGAIITKGSAVYVSGSTGNVPNIAKAKADALATASAIGIVVDDIAVNAFGQVMTVGNLINFNTSAFTTGDVLYVSAATAGALTATRPSGTTNLVQAVGRVLVSGVGNGSIEVGVSSFLGNAETGTNSATWTGTTVNATTVNATTFVGALTGTASGNLVSGGALGTPSSGTLTNATGLPKLTGLTGFYDYAIPADTVSAAGVNIVLPMTGSFTVGANETWTFQVYMVGQTSGTSGTRFIVVYSSAPSKSMVWYQANPLGVLTAQTDAITLATTPNTSPTSWTGAATELTSKIMGTVINGGSSITVTFKATPLSGLQTTTLRAGCYITARRVN